MKKINILIVILTLAIVAVSCETYDDYNTDRKSVVGFSDPSKNINGVPEGGTKSSFANVFISDVSNVDRTFSVIVVPVKDPLTNPPTATDNYTFDSTVVIPANTRRGIVNITAIDVSITSVRSYFALAIEGDTDIVSGGIVLVGVKN